MHRQRRAKQRFLLALNCTPKDDFLFRFRAASLSLALFRLLYWSRRTMLSADKNDDDDDNDVRTSTSRCWFSFPSSMSSSSSSPWALPATTEHQTSLKSSSSSAMRTSNEIEYDAQTGRIWSDAEVESSSQSNIKEISRRMKKKIINFACQLERTDLH